MKTYGIFVVGMAGLFAASLFAQPGGGRGMMWKMMDTDKNGQVSRLEWSAHFKSMDTDGNGKIDGDEIKAHRRKGKGMGPGAKRDPRMIALLDRDGDAKISSAEWDLHFKSMDANKDGVLDAAEFAKHRAGMRGK